MMQARNDGSLTATAFYLLGALELIKKKRKKPWIERQRLRHSYILSLLETDDLSDFIDVDSFNELLEMVRPMITNRDVIMNRSITAEQCLIATLLFLVGKGYQELKDITLICPQLLVKIVPETCSAIYLALSRYIKMPITKADWKAIAKGFQEKWQFNNCLGSLEARHILIRRPPGLVGTRFCNHKGTYSVICIAAVNANYEFIYVESGIAGNLSGTLVAQCNKLILGLLNDDLDVPDPNPLPGSDTTLPYFFIGDGFWPLDTNIMSPYIGDQISEAEKVFNYRLLRANTAENAFGLLKTQFRVFNRAIDLDIEDVNTMVIATFALHNFLIKKPCYLFPNALDEEDVENGAFIPGDWRTIADPLMPIRRYTTTPWNNGLRIRTDLTEYFNTVGKVPFQDEMVNVRPCFVPVASDNEEWHNISVQGSNNQNPEYGESSGINEESE